MPNCKCSNIGILLSVDFGVVWVVQTDWAHQRAKVQVGGAGLLVVVTGG